MAAHLHLVIDNTATTKNSTRETSTHWSDYAACQNHPTIDFFDARGTQAVAAKATCRGCFVREQCLSFAIDNNEKFGVWGGLTGRERRRLRRSA